jgi:hypothetical protein
MDGKEFTDWTPGERKQLTLILSIRGAISSGMYQLSTVYQLWLAQEGLSQGTDV